MIFVALGVLALAALVLLGRWPQLARMRGRWSTWGLAAIAGAAAVYDAARGGWIGGSILASTALWLVTSTLWPARRDAMPRAAAASMLGVPESASREEIDTAYRRLIRRVHPDAGGAAGLAAQLNNARDVMLGKGR